jgi:Protein of unknown function (DUF2752)
MLRAAAPPAITTLVAAILFLFPPEHYGFYPQCPIHQYLHLQCPGCGATRAIAALLHGHIAEAMHLNALVSLLLPFAAAYGILCYYRFLLGKLQRWPQPPTAAIYSTLAIAAVFTILRNLSLSSL